jgi:hypothetical protein
MARHTATGLKAAREILALLEQAEKSRTVREARRYVEELMTLNLTVPASRAVGPEPNPK